MKTDVREKYRFKQYGEIIFMIFVTVDNDEGELRRLSDIIFGACPGSVVYEFMDAMLSVKYICNNHVDIVIAKKKMRPVDGATLKRVIQIHKSELPVCLFQGDNMTDVCQRICRRIYEKSDRCGK